MLKNLKQMRLQRGYTQKQLAEMLKVDITTYGRYELGVTEPNIETLKKLSKILSVSVDTIIDNEKVKSNLEQELLDIFGQLNNYQQGKVIGYCKSMVDQNKEAKEKEIRDNIKKKS